MNDTKRFPSKIRLGLAWALASLLTGFLSSTASSYSNLGSLRALGVDMGFDIYLKQTFTDFKGIGPLLVIFTALGFAMAFPVAGIIWRKIKMLRPLVYICAGFAAIVFMFWLMERAFFGTPIIQGARDVTGMLTQAACGGIGGAVFAFLTPLKRAVR